MDSYEKKIKELFKGKVFIDGVLYPLILGILIQSMGKGLDCDFHNDNATLSGAVSYQHFKEEYKVDDVYLRTPVANVSCATLSILQTLNRLAGLVNLYDKIRDRD
jgi:hypothetical protein